MNGIRRLRNRLVGVLGFCMGIAKVLGAGAVIENVEVTATSWWDDQLGSGSFQWVGNLTNNSGLSAAYDLSATHQPHNDGVAMWHAKSWSVDPNPTVTFDLGGSYDLAGIHIWNGNQALDLSHIRRGVNEFELFVSVDGGGLFTKVGNYFLTVSPLPRVPVGAQNFELSGLSGVTHVRMRVLSTHNSPAGGGDYASLAEVMFTQVVEQDVLRISRFEIVEGVVVLAFPSEAGQVFDIYRSTDLVSGFDVPLVSGLEADGGGEVSLQGVINDFSGGVTLGDTTKNFDSGLSVGISYVFVPTNGLNTGREIPVVSWAGDTVTIAEDIAGDLTWTGGYRIQTPVVEETEWVDVDPPAGRAFYQIRRR